MDFDNLNSQNPIDYVEDIIHSKKWSFSRAADHELVADISSQWCQYRLYFSWSEQIRAINFTITFDLKFPSFTLNAIHRLLALINEKLWIGHFDITSKSGIPAFRHTLLVPQKNDILYNQLEELVDIAIYECEKYYPAFQLVLFDEAEPQKALDLCLLEPIGQA
tara:strand:- start:183 stop:674 length:492 start_codon:yes stop_codon:yes gene_type:complete